MAFLIYCVLILFYYILSVDSNDPAPTFIRLSLTDGLTQDEKTLIVKIHNYYRRRTSLGKFFDKQSSSNMIEMEWDDTAAAHAQAWASNCSGPPHGNHPGEGQNFAKATDANIILRGAFYNWVVKEAQMWTSKSLTGWFPQSRHYSQIVWATTYKVGCGFNSCPGFPAVRFVCNYSPPGNAYQSPYKVGPPCSQCPSWRRKCVEKALCGPSDNPSENIQFPTKGVPCKDKATRKSCVLTKKYCNSYQLFMKRYCRKTCNFC